MTRSNPSAPTADTAGRGSGPPPITIVCAADGDGQHRWQVDEAAATVSCDRCGYLYRMTELNTTSRISVPMPDWMRNRIRALADRDGVSVSEYCRSALADRLDGR